MSDWYRYIVSCIRRTKTDIFPLYLSIWKSKNRYCNKLNKLHVRRFLLPGTVNHRSSFRFPSGDTLSVEEIYVIASHPVHYRIPGGATYAPCRMTIERSAIEIREFQARRERNARDGRSDGENESVDERYIMSPEGSRRVYIAGPAFLLRARTEDEHGELLNYRAGWQCAARAGTLAASRALRYLIMRFMPS